MNTEQMQSMIVGGARNEMLRAAARMILDDKNVTADATEEDKIIAAATAVHKATNTPISLVAAVMIQGILMAYSQMAAEEMKDGISELPTINTPNNMMN